MAVVKSKDEIVYYTFHDEVRVKKFGFGSNLVTFLDTPSSQEQMVEEAFTPTNPAVEYKNLYNSNITSFKYQNRDNSDRIIRNPASNLTGRRSIS